MKLLRGSQHDRTRNRLCVGRCNGRNSDMVDSEPVVMTKYVNSRRHTNTRPDVFHTDLSCQYLREGHRPVSDHYVSRDELRECKWCAGTASRPKVQGSECPFCNETVSKLPDHLPCEASP